MIRAMTENAGKGADEARETRRRMEREMDRLGQQGEKLLGGGMHPHAGGEPEDAVELWGRRIGRGLGYAFALYLIWHLLSTYVLK